MAGSRERAKIELGYVIGNLDWALHHIKTFAELGYQERSEFSVQILALSNAIIEIQNAISRLKDSF